MAVTRFEFAQVQSNGGDPVRVTIIPWKNLSNTEYRWELLKIKFDQKVKLTSEKAGICQRGEKQLKPLRRQPLSDSLSKFG